ncbi:MAG: hypothetical protein JXQ90_08845 [Cyclobacteriaceae bacterium]
MAELEAFDKSTEVSGRSIVAFINAFPNRREIMESILARHDIENPDKDHWYPMSLWLEVLQELTERLSSRIIFDIGQAMIKSIKIPSHIESLRDALRYLNVAYRASHRNGDIGGYELWEFNEKRRIALIECTNPYPSEMDRGIISAITARYKPHDGHFANVTLDKSAPSRKDGAESCTFIVSW